MLALARRGLIQVLASDAHSSHGGRPLRISEGLAALEGVEMLRRISTGLPRSTGRDPPGDVPAPPFPTLS